jgi:hypothetical protein
MIGKDERAHTSGVRPFPIFFTILSNPDINR